ncbi:hypothetical protein FQR65_LT16942 [Abscondita terminalis]|nr:hypothetical protein FQR65_LT16942 [Abscondita terminalis]
MKMLLLHHKEQNKQFTKYFSEGVKKNQEEPRNSVSNTQSDEKVCSELDNDEEIKSAANRDTDDDILLHSPISTSSQAITSESPPTPTPSRCSSRSSKQQKTKSRDTLIEKVCKTLQSADEDEFDVVESNVAHKLRRMDVHKREYAEHLINNGIFYGLRNMLNESTFH